MIRGANYIQVYPNRSVVEDVLKRTGNPTEDSFSPFNGYAYYIDEQFRGSSMNKFNMDDLIVYTCNSKMDLDPTRVHRQAVINGLELIDKESAGYTYLEDMSDNDKAVKKWLEMVVVGYKKNSNSPYNTQREQHTNFVYDNDGEADDEKNFLTQENNLDRDVYFRTIDEIPYLLKIIHNRSKGINAQLFSFTRAYAIIRRTKNDAEIVPRDFANYTLYRMDSMGGLDRQFDHEKDNRSNDYRNALAFIRGANPHDYAYKACMKLITCLEAIGVDIQMEDPVEYNNSFINRLQCNYLVSNAEYFNTYADTDQELIMALSPDKLFKVDIINHMMDEDDVDTQEDIISYIKTGLHVAAAGPAPAGIDWREDKSEQVLSYIKAIKLFNDRKKNPNAMPVDFKEGMEFIDGLLYYRRSIVKFSGEFCGKFIGQYKGAWPDVIFSNYGMVIVLPKTFEAIYYQTIDECVKRATKIFRGEFNGGGWNIL